MAGIPGFRRGFRFPWRTARSLDAEVEEELRFHIDMRAAELATLRGLDEAAARAEALRQFGDLEDARRYMRAMDGETETTRRRRDRMAGIQRDLKHALRGLRRSPGFTVVAVLSLALGIGANTAIYSLFRQILLRPLAVPHPEALVYFRATGEQYGGMSNDMAGDGSEIFSRGMFRDLERAKAPGFLGIAAHRSFAANLTFGDRTVHADGVLASGSYFSLLGQKPALGRLLTPEDDRRGAGQHVAVLSHDYWANELGGDPSVLDRTITVNGQALTIVGVTSRGFQGLTLGVQPKVFVPVALAGEMVSWLKGFPERTGYWLYLFARLRPGVPESGAESAINRVYRPIIQEVEVPLQKGAGMSDRQLAEFRNRVLELKDASRGQSLLDDQVRTPLVLLFAITGIVLLIACANIANLLLARGASRRTEMAVRLSLGASRRHVVAQLLTESCVLAFLGGAAGLLVARGTLWSVRSILPLDLAGPLDFRLSTPVVLFTMALSLATGLLFGVFPALHGTRAGLIGSIRAGTGQIAEARGAARFRGSMVVVQIALSLVLLISAGLFLKSLRNVVRAELGIRTDHVVTFRLSPELNGYPERKSRQFFERMEEDLAALPGVTSVTAATVSLFSGFSNGSGVIRMEGVRAGPGATSVGASFNLVGPQYFRTLGIPILAGRELTAVDRDGAPKVAVVNEAFAKQFGLGRDIVGKRFNPWGGEELDVEIVGVARDTKYSEVKGKVPPTFFLAVRQMPNIGSLQFYVRTSGDPAALVRRVPGAVAGVDPRLPVEGLETLPQQVRESVVLDRMVSTFSSGYAMLATLLAAVGLYGVLAYTVAQRTREIGVRVALGADGRRVRLMVLRQVGWMLLLGSGIGVAAALGLGRWAGSLLYGLTSYDPVVILTALLTISLVALGAGYLPARRASRVSPMEALRAE